MNKQTVIEAHTVEQTDKQILWNLLLPNSADVYAGRGSGKSTHIAPPWIIRNLYEMPRAVGGIAGKSYSQILTSILPKLLGALSFYGFVENVHYWVGKLPPKGTPTAYYMPREIKRCLTFWNGHCILFLSQDKKSPGNGIDLQYIWLDEGKLIDWERFSAETLPTLRGLKLHYGQCSGYLGLLVTSDKPQRSQAPWMYERKKSFDPKAGQDILAIQRLLIAAKAKMGSQPNRSRASKVGKEIAELEQLLMATRKETRMLFEMNTIDNIAVLGIEAIQKLKQDLDDDDFNRSVLNIDDTGSGNSFYAQFNYQKHVYHANATSHVLSLGLTVGLKQDSRWDSDLISSAPLEISLDYNAAITCMVIGQWQRGRLNILNALYVTSPDTLYELVTKFVTYYENQVKKVVNYYYDNTAIGRDSSGRKTYADSVSEALIKAGWRVNKIYTGQASTHHDRYAYLMKILKEDEKQLPIVRFNELNCQQLFLSMEAAKATSRNGFIKKDKSSERSTRTKPENATHLSEALDGLLTGAISRKGTSAVYDLPTSA